MSRAWTHAVPWLPILGMQWLTCLCMTNAAEPQVFRTFMPEAGPSAFGVVLGPDLALCYDDLRGGVNQVWLGSLDLTPTFQAKINQPATIKGTVFYKEGKVQPLRVNDATKAPERRFKGYRYDKNAVIFHYTLDGVAIRETLRASDEGHGMMRSWSVPEGVALFFHAETQPDAHVTFDGGEEIAPGVWRHVGQSGKSFMMVIKPRSKS